MNYEKVVENHSSRAASRAVNPLTGHCPFWDPGSFFSGATIRFRTWGYEVRRFPPDVVSFLCTWAVTWLGHRILWLLCGRL